MKELQHANDNHLARFLDDARKFPMLSAEQERDLTERWREDSDEAALELLVGSHLRLVVKIAKSNRGYGLPMDDVIAEGYSGLMQAVERFDPDRGFRFATYAQWWIRAAIKEYVLRSWSIVRLGTTAPQKKLFFNLRRLKSSLDALEEGDLTPDVVAAIATELDVPAQDVIEMNRRLAAPAASLNVPVGDDGDTSRLDVLRDEGDDQEMTFADAEEFDKRWALITEALKQLKPRERHILTERKLSESPKTLEDLSAVYSISRERVRQIEAIALGKLEKAVAKAAACQGLLRAPGPNAMMAAA